ncbi:MAG: MerR family transcriptional regulator [Lachnospiraceae bacterium]|nr:MerR family transcriptional regulator [Lachnospiraceae bacterium]
MNFPKSGALSSREFITFSPLLPSIAFNCSVPCVNLVFSIWLIQVRRNDAGRRCYDESDIEWIRFIKRLKMLERHRENVLGQQEKWAEYLSNLDDKIAFYRDSIF